MIYHPRTGWVAARPVTGPPLEWDKVVDVIYHDPGSNILENDPARQIRNMHHSYLDNPKRGYSLGYNWCIDLRGEVWEVRGFDIRSAATGGYNTQSVAIQFLVDSGNMATEAQLTSAVEMHKRCEHRARRKLGVFGHFQKGTTQTSCPNAIKSQLEIIRRRVTEISPTPAPIVATTGIGVIMDRYLNHNGVIYGYDSEANIKQHVPDPQAWDVQRNLRAMSGKPPLEVLTVDRSTMRAMGPVIGPVPAGHDAYGAKL